MHVRVCGHITVCYTNDSWRNRPLRVKACPYRIGFQTSQPFFPFLTIQIRLGPDVFTFVEVVKCKKSGRVELVKMQPSLRMEAPGDGRQTQKPVQVPIPSPDPCLLGLGPCP